MSAPRLAALLLAGGASSRMGSPKALLDFGGEPLWRRQVAKLQALGPSEVFISAPRTLPLPDGDWTILHDEKPQLGPLAGMASALPAMSSDWLVVLAIDMPAMTTDYLRQLYADAQRTGLGQVPQLDGYHLGLAAVYPRAVLDFLEGHLRSEDRSLQNFVREGITAGTIQSQAVPENERPVFANINSPGEYLEASATRSAPS